MSVEERDPHTGHMTTGHEWNGIKELNTNVPKLVWYCLATAVIISIAMWFLLPSWPLGTVYTKGILGADDRVELSQEMKVAAAKSGKINAEIMAASYEDAKLDPSLLNYVRNAGKPLFTDNCSACHGVNGKGGPSYPNLADKAWLWADEDETVEETIMETLRVGINVQHPDTRTAQMLAFGKDGTLDRPAIDTLIDYVLNLNETTKNAKIDQSRLNAGGELFQENCASCHGENAMGNTELGAPNLTDASWIYGNTRQQLFDTIWKGRQGQMPAWEARLSQENRKLMTLYVLDLGSEHHKDK